MQKKSEKHSILLEYFPLSRCNNRSSYTMSNLLFKVKISESDPKIWFLDFRRVSSGSGEFFYIRLPFAELVFVATIRRL
jgi:hypothetical protein